MRWRITLLAAIGGLVAGLAIAVAVLVARRPRETLRESHTVVEAVRNVAKLATVEMSVSNWQLRRDEKALFGVLPIPCRKTVAVFYRGKVAAGFDLQPASGAGLTVAADAIARRLTVRLPAPRVLYTDVPTPELVVADGSLCNDVTRDDYALLHEEARRAVQREAVNSGVLARAEAQARTLIEGVARPLGYEVVVQVEPGAPPIASSAKREGP